MTNPMDIDNRLFITNSYNEMGFYLSKKLFDNSNFLAIEALIFSSISKHCPCQNIHSAELSNYFRKHPEAVTKVYDNLQNHQHLIQLGKSKKITDIVHRLIPNPALYLKSVLRVDPPFESKELAYWHQDDYYVKGNEDELTVWIPLQDTNVPQGCLSVMPGSHKLGRLEHSYSSGKKRVPMGIYDREVRLIEMAQGDALFFSSLLVHSSNFNFSDSIRYSIQLRYTSSDKPPSSIMRGTVNV